jgi:RNA polymerase sigma factor (TIGR02999 family)
VSSDPTQITELLARLRSGDRAAESRLFEILYRDLRRLANSYLKLERANHTLQPTALVHEAYLRLFGRLAKPIRDRQHFLALASRAMRRLLVDHARMKRTRKRDWGLTPCSVTEALVYDPRSPDQLIFIDEMLTRLSEWDARQGRVIELRFFGGLTEREIAEVLGVSERTVKRDYKVGQAWLAGEFRKAGIRITQ